MNLTPEQEQEWLKCHNDFKYFSRHYLRIQNPERGMIPFELYKFQERVIDNYEIHKLNILKKFRQGGLTTLTVLWMLWRCMFKLDQMVLVMSKTDREAIKAGKIFSKALQNIRINHPWLCPELKTDSLHDIVFDATNSSIEFRTVKAARGQSLTHIVIDEAAFIQGMQEAWKDMYPTVAAGGKVIVISTVNGRGNWYEQTYTDAIAKRNTFNVIEIALEEHPIYKDPEWQKNTRANMSARDWAQEFEGSFLGSGNTFFGSNVLIECEKRARGAVPIEKKFPEWDTDKALIDLGDTINDISSWERGALWVWEKPEKGEEYIVSVDAALGVGEDGDYSAIQIINQVSLEQVAEFYSNTVPPQQLAMIAVNLATYYNRALLIIEALGPGQVVIDRVVNDHFYENIYYHRVKAVHKPGIVMNLNNRVVILESLQNYLLNGFLKINSLRMVREMDTFVFDNSRKKAIAIKGKHDDLIMSMAFAIYVRDQTLKQMPAGVASPTAQNKYISDIFEEIKKEIQGDIMDMFPKDDPLLWNPQKFIPGLPDGFQRKGEKILKEFNW